MSFLRAGGLLRYVDGMSKSYVYFDGDSVVDYATLNAEGFVELVLLHAKDKENRILWDYLIDRAELFMSEEDVREFKKWADNRQLDEKSIQEILDRLYQRHSVILRVEPLV